MGRSPIANETLSNKEVLKLADVDPSDAKAGWRAVDRGRVDELKESFKDGKWGLCAGGSDIWWQGKTNVDGKHLPDDGRSSVIALCELFAEWEAAAEDSEEWDDKLVDLFENGVSGRNMEYPLDDSLAARKVYHAGRHNVDNNKMRFTPVSIICDCGIYAYSQHSNKDKAVEYLMAQHGRGSKTSAYVWINAGLVIPKETRDLLETMPYLKPSYVVYNNYFMASSPSDRLADEVQLRALGILKDNASLNASQKINISAEKFKDSICGSLKYLFHWKRKTIRKFGDIAASSQAFSRLIDHLSTESGVKTVAACKDAALPLEGKSDAEVGVPECRKLWAEFAKTLAGSAPPGPLQQSTPQGSNAISLANLSSEELEAVEMTKFPGRAGVELTSQVPEKDMEHIKVVETLMENVEVYSEDAKLLQRSSAFADKRCFVLVEAPTSSKSTLSQFIELAFKLSTAVGTRSHLTVVTLLQDRLDIIGDAKEKIESRFTPALGWRTDFVQIARGEVQNDRVKPQFAFRTFHAASATKNKQVPMSISFKGGKSFEKLRFRCRALECKFLSLGGQADDDVAMEDRQAKCSDAMTDDRSDDSAAEEDGDELCEAMTAKRPMPAVAVAPAEDKILEVFAFANSRSYYEAALDLATIQEMDAGFILSTTCHPSSWYVAKQHLQTVQVYVPRSTEHSLYHGKKILTTMFLQERLKGTDRANKRLVMRNEAAFIRGPILQIKGQSVTPFDVHQRNAWCDGLNKVNWEGDTLQGFVDKQVASEIDNYQVQLTAPRDACGRGLVAGKSYKEGDRIMNLSCLYFDEVSVDALENISSWAAAVFLARGVCGPST